MAYNCLVNLFSKPVDWFRFLQLFKLFLFEKRGQKPQAAIWYAATNIKIIYIFYNG